MPNKYRKKPVVIEAMQVVYGKTEVSEVEKFVGDPNILHRDLTTGQEYIRTLEGKMLVSDGDYIIKGIQGEFYPCKPDIFEATYEESKTGLTKAERETYRNKKSLIHALMIIYGFTQKEANKAVRCEKVSNFIFDNLESKVTGYPKEPRTVVNYFNVKEGLDVEEIAEQLHRSLEKVTTSH